MGDQYAHAFGSVADSVKTMGGGGYVGVTTTIFQDHERPLFVVGIVSERSFEVEQVPAQYHILVKVEVMHMNSMKT